MRIFSCSGCGHTVFFENVECTRCRSRLGYLPDQRRLGALKPVGSKLATAEGALYRSCRNALEYAACNWMIPDADPHSYCRACRLTSVMPDLDVPEAMERWGKLEQAKRRTIYTIDALGLPLESRRERPTNGLTFVFLTQGDFGPKEMVMTGHANGMVTINTNEADDPYREQVRKEMKEAYRTLLGHFRHEVGHYYWDRLIRDSAWLGPFRQLFGDERLDYAKAAKRHYTEGPPRAWQRTHVSAYATMHPWEDWAETWSHYLHIADTLDTARAYSVALQAKPIGSEPGESLHLADLDVRDFFSVIHAWVTLTGTLNNLNRSMGLADPYPFVLSAEAVKKLRFVHDVIDRWRDAKPDEVRGRWPDRVSAPDGLLAKYD